MSNKQQLFIVRRPLVWMFGYALVLIEKISDISESPILLNADKRNSRSCYQMNIKYIAIVAVIAAILVGTTAITTENAFATKYHKNQAISQTNACGNGELPLNVGCQNIDSQIQGDENVVSLAADQVFPEIEEEEEEKPVPG